MYFPETSALLETKFDKILFTGSERDTSQSPDYAQVLNAANMYRLDGYLTGALSQGIFKSTPTATTISGWESLHTILKSAKTSMKVKSEEIFGPILSIISIPNVEDGLSKALELPAPLASCVLKGGERGGGEAAPYEYTLLSRRLDPL